MKTRTLSCSGGLCRGALVALIGLLGACSDGKPSGDAPPGPYPYDTYLTVIRDVDLLFVIDNSGSMADEQDMLRAQFSALINELHGITGGLPNLHIGVTSTDLGAGSHGITFCDGAGDGGRLLTGNCSNPTGAPYLVDVAPADCEVTRDATGGCSSHDCQTANCGHESSTLLVIDAATGCPRCRNFIGQDLDDAFSCIAGLGTSGCGFEQPLEAMVKALDSANSQNIGFVRESALLGVIFLTDEDDCSASDPDLFDPSDSEIDSPLGPLTSFRCFEFGVTCDVNGREPGLRTGCVPREDAGAMLHPVSRYINFLRALKDPQMLVLSSIAGPVTDQQVRVGLDEHSQPEVQNSCPDTTPAVALPGIRIRAVTEALNRPEDLSLAYTPICAPTYTDALEGIGQRILASLVSQCLPAPLQGCTDPGAEYGLPGDTYPGNDQCLASCLITDIFLRGTLEETRADVPPCLEVCPAGPCPGNTDRNLAYASGHPPERDPSLPVGACWHVGYLEVCDRSNHAEVIISRTEDPPPRSFANVTCILIPQTEQICHDGEDNDEDGLVDMDDPDCAG